MSDDHIARERIAVALFGPAIAPSEPVVRGTFAPERPGVLLVASDWERKGGADALAAFTELRKAIPGATLTVVGDAVPRLPEGVVGLRRVDRTRMAEAYASHDVLLELARSNAAGVTLTDVAGFGLPAVATDIGGVSSVVRNDTSGVLLAPGPHLAERAASAITRICTTPGLWHHLVQGSLDHAREVLNWDHWADVTLSVLGECAAEYSGDKDDRDRQVIGCGVGSPDVQVETFFEKALLLISRHVPRGGR
ncbi:glycosyltransferase family 4 protein [Raineyella sp. LH-20]|uniref:glycosyltransferase family 4 protein n=1 Tax=Raineyella sp. LH-20 TaxID=3081204 RepID=UPI002952C6A6|nr:glycosyltransferase family 4 protein [Raineyella sp. LH-20]WOP20118.1 glycosyltransferase family 4 protein [Raineyella sp. LH-20]